MDRIGFLNSIYIVLMVLQYTICFRILFTVFPQSVHEFSEKEKPLKLNNSVIFAKSLD
jgi:hypothetical protein